MPNNIVNTHENTPERRHSVIIKPSEWVCRFAPLIPAKGRVLDFAAGGGRHSRHLLGLGYRPVAIDKNASPLDWLATESTAEVILADLETVASPFKTGGVLSGRMFEGVIVTNYLYRPLMEDLIGALKPGGVFIYETFSRGNEQFSRPRNPDHLLKSGELLDLVHCRLQVVSYEHGRLGRSDNPAVKQRICAVKDLQLDNDDNPPIHPIYPAD